MTDTATAPTGEQQPEQSKGNAAVEWLKGQYALFILIVLLIIAALSSPAFLTGTNITNLLLQMSIIGVVVMAELLVALAVGGIVGLVNGWLVAFRGLEPFIVTLGMLALARGLVYAYSEGIPITPEASATFAQIGQTTVLGIPILTLIWIAMVLLFAFLLKRTVWGRRVYAIGSNKEASRSSGIPVRATLWSVYILAGLLVGLGGWMFVCRFGSATALAGNLMELEAIAAVVIGGAALSGGRGTVFGAVIGTIIFQVIANLLSLLNVSTFLQDAFRGALILVAVTLATVQFARKRSR